MTAAAAASRFHDRPVDRLLSRLQRVREVGPGKWAASSPTREDRHPSLAIRELPDGRVLIHDFAGDSAAEIVAAVGLTLSDLYPAPVGHHLPKARVTFPALPALRALAFEASVVFEAAATLASGAALSAYDIDRLQVAAERIDAALRVVEGAA